MGFFTEEYKKEWQFFKSEMKNIFLCMLILMIVLMIGAHFAVSELFKREPEMLKKVSEIISFMMKGITFGEESAFMLSIKLFFNNARACLIAIGFGVIPFIFLSLYSFFLNGFLVGIVTAVSSAVAGVGTGFLLASLVPHGIFELPAIVYSCALGVYICKEISKIILKKSTKRVGDVIAGTLRSYVLVILPMLIIAAFVESYITMYIAMKFI